MIKISCAEILCVGTELLIGDIVNTNAAFISKRLASLGFNQYYQACVGDNPARLTAAIDNALSRCDLLITSGGLGPTYDDLTKETVASALGRELELHERSLERMREFFVRRGIEMSENNVKQAMMPVGAVVFDNDWGTAPGLAVEDEERGKIVIMLPGPPRELEPMFDTYIMPYLRTFASDMLVSRNINITGMGESSVESRLRPLMEAALNPTVAPYCKEGEVRLRVTAKTGDYEAGLRMCDEMVELIRESEVGPYIYGVDTDLEHAVVEALRANSLTLGTAESCTGGLIASRITDVAGCSDVFVGGVVSYANSVKESALGVGSDTLRTFGAVSEETAREMAAGVRARLGCEVGLATTGIAGPGGGTPEKPVGLVYVACAYGDKITVDRLTLSGTREHIRHLAANRALKMALEAVRG
jgi:competence/damage-inducible protein CinA C-terminal domain